jgi:hypothetical protein
MFEIMIKDNMDIFSIVDLLKKIYKKIITNNFEIIEKLPIDKVTSIKNISICYSIILSNFSYIIQLVQDNFGLNSKKIFGEVIDLMKIEMDELVKALVLAYLHEQIFENEKDWKIFLVQIKKIKEISNIYFQNGKLKWEDMTLNLYQEYIANFNEIKTKEITEEYNELLWDQITNIKEQYQSMFDVLNNNQNLNELKIDIDKIITISDEKADNNENKNEYLIIKSDTKNSNETGLKHKISKFSYCYIKYLYEYLVLYSNIPMKVIRENIINRIMKLTKDILTLTRDIILNNETGKINNTKLITEKETALYYSDLFIIQKCLKKLLETNPTQSNIKEVTELLNSLKTNCYEIVFQLVSQVSGSFLSEFNTLTFTNYKTFPNAKEYNSYIKKLTPLKRVYDNLNNLFLDEDIKKLFSATFDEMLNKFKQSVTNKGIIEKDDQLKQFRNEMNYMKKVFKLFTNIDCEKYKVIIDDLIIKVNPNKLPKKKKKAKQEKDEKEDDNAD